MYTSYDHAYAVIFTNMPVEQLTQILMAFIQETHNNSKYRHTVYSYLFMRFGQSCLHCYTFLHILVRCFLTKELFGCSSNTITLFV